MRGRAAGEEDDAPKRRSGNVSHIGNKHKRQDVYREYRKEKRREKLQRRLKTAKEERTSAEGKQKKKERLAQNKTRTIENSRTYNPTVLNVPNTHEVPAWMKQEKAEAAQEAGAEDDDDDDDDEVDEDDEEEEDDDDDKDSDDEQPEEIQEPEAAQEDLPDLVDPHQAKYDVDADPSAPPAILITTSLPSNSTSPHLASANARSHPAEAVRDFVKELLNVFPGAEYRPRAKAKGAGLGKISSWARSRRYDAVMVVGESNKKPCTLTLVQLPLGPTALFRLTSISMGKGIYGHARSTGHSPELILNNFTTALGHRVGHMLQHLFPKVPDLEGRQVVTAHNQRDYVFFRRHRYEFRSTEKAALQEIGPRFTLKLISMAAGLPKGAGAWNGRFVDDLETEAPPADEEDVEHAAPDDGIEFKWKPKMSASRRNFYL